MIARRKRQGVPPLFAPVGPLSCQIGSALVLIPQPGACCRARGPPQEAPNQDRDGIKSLGRCTTPSPDMLLGQRSDPASPAENQAPALNQQTKETW
ncbi:MAG TPA: hypothetical protein VGG59_12510 [Acidobacteriaceae bacterium]|jgi:hypothetical protein